MIIVKRNFRLSPYIETIKPISNLDLILALIEEYIKEKARQSVFEGQKERILHLSGLAEYHHKTLLNYLNRNIQTKDNFHLVEGEFGPNQIKHWWLKADDLLIDLTLKQFRNHTNLFCNPWQIVLTNDCYLSNNSASKIYQYYHQLDE